MGEGEMRKARKLEGFGQKLSGNWLKHREHIVKLIPEAKDIRIQSYSQVPAWQAFAKDEFQIKKAGFSANELVNIYDVDFIEKEGCKGQLERRVRKLTRRGELGYYIWTRTKILRTCIILERVGKYEKQ